MSFVPVEEVGKTLMDIGHTYLSLAGEVTVPTSFLVAILCPAGMPKTVTVSDGALVLEASEMQ